MPLKGAYSNLRGRRFGRLKVLELERIRWVYGKSRAYWVCQCDCGAVRVLPNTSLRSGRTKSCGCLQRDNSRKAMIRYHKTAIGPRHPDWDPGISRSQRENVRKYYYYSGSGLQFTNAWRRKVFGRDWYRCAFCGASPSGQLCAHHLNAWKTHRTQRFWASNGVTLCRTCHRAYHRVLGRTPATKKHFTDLLVSYRVCILINLIRIITK